MTIAEKSTKQNQYTHKYQYVVIIKPEKRTHYSLIFIFSNDTENDFFSHNSILTNSLVHTFIDFMEGHA